MAATDRAPADLDLDLREREELCDLFLRLGPDAPTLCEGWTTADLAAHLAVREHDPRSGPGILFGGPFAAYTDKLMAREKKRGFDAVVARVRRPPRGPLSIPAVRRAMSLVEYVVHHEDVRRANGDGPRSDDRALQDGAWSGVTKMLPLMVRRARTGRRVELVTPDGRRKAAGKGATVEIHGDPVELLLYLEGRQGAAQVELRGDPGDVAAVRAGRFGI